jgi:hypothetical protein
LREGKKLRDVRVRDFVPDHHILWETVSYYHSRKVDGNDTEGRLKVEGADGKILLFKCHHRKDHRSLTNDRSEPLRLFLLANPKFQMNGTFGNVYEHGEWARAYATLEFPGPYYLAFRDLPALIRRYDHGSPCSTSAAAPFDRTNI